MTNEELTALVEERLEAGTMGFAGLYSTNQINFREAWTDAMDWLHDMCNADFDTYNPLRMKMLEALQRHEGDRLQDRRQVYAVNTTFHGRDANEDHAPIVES